MFPIQSDNGVIIVHNNAAEGIHCRPATEEFAAYDRARMRHEAQIAKKVATSRSRLFKEPILGSNMRGQRA